MKKKSKHLAPYMVFTIWLMIVAMTILIIHHSIKEDVNEKTSDAELVLESTAEKIEYSINSRLLNLRTLEVLVNHDSGMLCDFEEHASHIYESDPCVRCIQLAPNGVITHVYPLEGNENSFGNLFVNQLRKENARNARDAGVMTLGGPYELHQGGIGMVARRPIYMDSNGNSVFWGFAIEVLDLNTLLETAEISELEESGYSYRLWHYAPRTGEPVVFAGDEKLPDIPITAEIKVPGSTWYLSIVPTARWFSSQLQSSALTIFIAFNLLTLAIAIAYLSIVNSKKQLEITAITDPLTGLKNSRGFYETVEELSSKHASFYIYYLDLNKFKEVNDNHGHYVGNQLLRAVAQRMAATDSDNSDNTTLFRIGGDEFAIVKLGYDNADAKRHCDELREAMKHPFSFDGIVLPISTSIGYANFPMDNADYEKVLRLAEMRMYEDKARVNLPVATNSRRAFFNSLRSLIDENLARDSYQNFYFYHIDYKNFKLINYKRGIDVGEDLIKNTVSYINALPECVLCSRGYADWIFFVTKEPASMTRDEVIHRFMDYYNSFIADMQKSFPDIVLSLNCGVSMIIDNDIENAAGRANVGRVISKNRNSEKPVFVDAELAEQWMNGKAFESAVLLATRQQRIHYELQPIVSADDKKIAFAEALGRLTDRNGNILSPENFVPVLTENSYIIEFDLHILSLVCKDISDRLHKGQPVVPVSVNISPLHINNPHAAQNIRSILESNNVPGELIIIEITEDIMLHGMKKLLDFCTEIHKSGIRIFLDDFGSGYLNFEILKEIPVDAIKSDKSLVCKNPGELNRESKTVSGIFALAKSLKLFVICEGIEASDKGEWMARLGADYLQGYCYSRPDAPKEIYKKYL